MDSVTWHPYIVEDDEFKVLQFAEWDIQSKMSKAAPDELVLSYTQAMVAFMLFVEEPKDVLIVGLGGGSLSKFCFSHLPSTRITTVEISREVIELRDEFCIPPDSARFRIVHDDIATYLDGIEQLADVILLDGYDPDGIPSEISGPAFYTRCNAALTEHGILVANINLGATSSSLETRKLMEQVVGPTISIRSKAGHNDILFGFRHAELPDVKTLKKRALELRKETGVDFPLLLDKLRSGANAAEGFDTN